MDTSSLTSTHKMEVQALELLKDAQVRTRTPLSHRPPHTHLLECIFFGGKQNLNILFGLVFRFETPLKSVSITRRFRSVGTPIVSTPSVPPAAASHTPSPIFATKNKTVNRQNIFMIFLKNHSSLWTHTLLCFIDRCPTVG